jgi:hypothetical protein
MPFNWDVCIRLILSGLTSIAIQLLGCAVRSVEDFGAKSLAMRADARAQERFERVLSSQVVVHHLTRKTAVLLAERGFRLERVPRVPV